MKLSLSSVTDTDELGLAITATTLAKYSKNIKVNQANKPVDNVEMIHAKNRD
jgi:hypothetical protein